MGVFFSNQIDGSAVIYRDELELKMNPVPPTAVHVRRFDEKTNTALVAAWQVDSQQFSLAGGTLTVDGVPATFQPDGAYFSAKLRAPALIAKFRDSEDPFTREELADLFAVAFHADGLLNS
jgi:hypothetical protein